MHSNKYQDIIDVLREAQYTLTTAQLLEGQNAKNLAIARAKRDISTALVLLQITELP